MEKQLHELVFPLSWQEGGSIQGIQIQRMRSLAELSAPVVAAELEKMILGHQLFLQNGGAGGAWQTILVKGLVVALYPKKEKLPGQQFSLEYRNLSGALNLSQLALPFANFCAAWLPAIDCSKADLSHSLFTDANLQEANFRKATLVACDFSRADLRGACFHKADLQGADFENCDLRDADFRGARLSGARFPGAQLEGVVG